MNSGSKSENLLHTPYRFSTTLLDENPKLCKQYIREVMISQLNFKNEATKFQLLCKKHRFEDPHITSLIRKTAYVFDILIVIVNSEDRIIAVENEKELQKEWEELKEELHKSHAGYGFEEYVHNMDLTIYNKEKLIAFLESDKMYGLFFKGLYMYAHIDQLPQYSVLRIGNIIKMNKKTDNKLQSEEYIFKDNHLTECLKINENIQYELLCPGLKKLNTYP